MQTIESIIEKSQRLSSIYVLLCPITGRPTYVGKAIDPNRRYGQHCSLSNNQGLSPREKWLRGLAKRGRKPELVVLQCEVVDWDEAERFWVTYLRDRGFILVNSNDGGFDMEHASSAPKSNRSRGKRTSVALAVQGIKQTMNHFERAGDTVRAERVRRRYVQVTSTIARVKKQGWYDLFCAKHEAKYGHKQINDLGN